MARGLVLIVAIALIWAVVPGDVAPAQTTLAQRLTPPTGSCTGKDELDAPLHVQRRAMLCMINSTRRSAGLARLSGMVRLSRSADSRSREILRCNSFSHFACGRAFTSWVRRVGCDIGGENLAWGTGYAGTVRSIFRGWMRSPAHRRNIFGRFAQVGVGLRVGTLSGYRAAHVWTQHFGSHCRR